jgi:hypothetical protein
VIGGMTPIACLAVITSSNAPQWSPPVIGGMTRTTSKNGALPEVAAMEPAGDQRDDNQGEEYHNSGRDAPQWSPPAIGENTCSHRPPLCRMVMPQWGPPAIGGSTSHPPMPIRIHQSAAMEPACNRREHDTHTRAADR